MNFIELGISKRVSTALETIGFAEPTEIQEKTIPAVLMGRDIMASAETGSGKTAAYALPIIHGIRNNSQQHPRILVLVPTRELAVQVQSEFERFSFGCGLRSVTIYGGTGYEKQMKRLKRGVDVVVATPGRLIDHIDRRNIDLSHVRTLVLDEADRMLDMGFMPQVKRIVKLLTAREQTLMFSATIDKDIEATAATYLKDPIRVAVNKSQVEPVAIDQRLYHVDESAKTGLLLELIKDQPDVDSVIVFARTRSRVKRIRKQLSASNVAAEEIHGDISQNKRDQTLARYRNGAFSVLVATDVAARGLDIPTISHVVNYDLPVSAEDYVHRIGRTGRAGRTGTALSFVSSEQRSLVRGIEKITGKKIEKIEMIGSASAANGNDGDITIVVESSRNGGAPQAGRRKSRPKNRSRARQQAAGRRDGAGSENLSRRDGAADSGMGRRDGMGMRSGARRDNNSRRDETYRSSPDESNVQDDTNQRDGINRRRERRGRGKGTAR